MKENPLELIEKLAEQCEESYDRWEYLYKNGGQDPFWEDGVNLNLVRNHILHYQRQISDICEEECILFVPDIINRDPPPEVDNKYMARTEYILSNAQRILSELKQNELYMELLKLDSVLSDDIKKKVYYRYAVSYVPALERAIRELDYVTMRRYLNLDVNDSFRRCIDRIRDKRFLAEETEDSEENEEKQCEYTGKSIITDQYVTGDVFEHYDQRFIGNKSGVYEVYPESVCRMKGEISNVV